MSSILDIDLHTFLELGRQSKRQTSKESSTRATANGMKGFYLGSGRRSEDQGLAILPSINYNGPMADESVGRRQN